MTLLTPFFFSLLSISPTAFSAACIFNRSSESVIAPGLEIEKAFALGLRPGRFVRLKETDTRIEMSGPSTSAIVIDVVHKLKRGSYEDWRLSIHRCLGEPDKAFPDGQLIWEMSSEQPFNVRLRTPSRPTLQFAYPWVREKEKAVTYSFGIPDVGVFTVEPVYRSAKFNGFLLKRVVTPDADREPEKVWIGYKDVKFSEEGDYMLIPSGKQIVLEFEDGDKLALILYSERRPTGFIDDIPFISEPSEGILPEWLDNDLDDVLDRMQYGPLRKVQP